MAFAQTVNDVEYSFECPALEGTPEEIIERYGAAAVTEAFCKARFPSQTVSGKLRGGETPEAVQSWLNDWQPGSGRRLSPQQKLLRDAMALGPSGIAAVKAALAQYEDSHREAA